MADDAETKSLAAEIVAAYVANNQIETAAVPAFIREVMRALDGQDEPAAAPAEEERPKLTSAQIRKSVTPDAIISFEDGRPYKSMKRHLAGKGLTPQQYREKWGLAKDYPMTAPNYSAQRSALAKQLGLGQGGRGKSAAKGRKRAAR